MELISERGFSEISRREIMVKVQDWEEKRVNYSFQAISECLLTDYGAIGLITGFRKN